MMSPFLKNGKYSFKDKAKFSYFEEVSLTAKTSVEREDTAPYGLWVYV